MPEESEYVSAESTLPPNVIVPLPLVLTESPAELEIRTSPEKLIFPPAEETVCVEPELK